ncbi:MAG: 4a-hydroxytetrahydrobiopterin dehydratase [Rhodoferax sp.]
MPQEFKQNTPAAPVLLALSATQVIAQLAKLDGWKLFGNGPDVAIEKTFHFGSHLETMAFANAVAFVAQSHHHHPEMLIGYQHCSVRWRTHAVQGISVADFQCAARVDALLAAD